MSRALIACLLPALLIAGCDRGKPAAGQGNAAAPAAPAAAGQVDRSHKGEAMPPAALTDMAGKPAALPGRGGPVLVNLWATWCAPCIKEMPTLDALAGQRRGTLAVVPVAQDLDGAKTVAPWLAKSGLKNLHPLLDTKLALSTAYAANLPTTILYGADGRERWRYAGSLDWTGPEAAKLLAEAR